MTASYTIKPFSVDQIGAHGGGSISCKILGFWSSDPITLYIDRRGYFPSDAGKPLWYIKLSHSSGGREPKEVECDMDAAINFADAMRAMAKLGKEILELYGTALEAAYQKRAAEDKAKFEAERAELNAKFEADTPIGIRAAGKIIEEMVEIAEEAGHCVREFHKRGSKQVVSFRVQHNNKVVFYVNGQRDAKMRCAILISEMSAKGVVV